MVSGLCVRARVRAVLHWVWLPGVDRMYCRDVGDVGGETSGTTHPLTQCHNPEDLNLQQHQCENFKCHNSLYPTVQRKYRNFMSVFTVIEVKF